MWPSASRTWLLIIVLGCVVPVFGHGCTHWLQQRELDQPGRFQFAIIGDVTSGERPGILDDAIAKLNMLQPMFVMSIGDLVAGYSFDPRKIAAQYDAFDKRIAALEMPFFRVPGNHDISTPVMAMMYAKRYGQAYTHFVYRDVLFLLVNTEDQRLSNISDEQVEYFRKTLQEHRSARWTLVFMHKPLWLEKDPGNWLVMEELLADRPYTVFAGHRHNYRKFERNGREYLMLATTGGGSKMRGAKVYGEFDHLTWVTMTENGPKIVLLALDGIFGSDLRTETTPPPAPTEQQQLGPEEPPVPVVTPESKVN